MVFPRLRYALSCVFCRTRLDAKKFSLATKMADSGDFSLFQEFLKWKSRDKESASGCTSRSVVVEPRPEREPVTDSDPQASGTEGGS